MNIIEFYLAFKLKEVEEYHLTTIANEMRTCLFERKVIESGSQFKIYTDVEVYPLKKRVLKVQFLCKIKTDAVIEIESLQEILQPAFEKLKDKKGLDEFKVKSN
jgi:hypothetical protein